MKSKLILIAGVSAIIGNSLFACISEKDQYSAGVLFNSGETFAFDKIEKIGKENENYFKVCTLLSPVVNAKNITILTPEMKPALYNDQVTINRVSINGNTLVLSITYGGGSKTHDFSMFASQSIGKSLPPTVFLTLSHNANGDNSKSLITETVNFNLTSIKSIISGYDEAQLLIQIPSGVVNIYTTTSATWYLQNECSIQYRSHSNPSMLVSLEYIPHFQTGNVFPGIRLISNPSIRTLVAINYGVVVANEMKWLNDNGIIKSFDMDQLKMIEAKVEYKHGQYWTKQDSVLDYNSVFTYKNDNEGNYIWDTVKTDTSITSCGEYTNFALPKDSLSGGSTKVINLKKEMGKNIKLVTDNKNITILFAEELNNDGKVMIIDLKGKVISQANIRTGQTSIRMKSDAIAASGVYTVIYRSGVSVFSTKVLVAK